MAIASFSIGFTAYEILAKQIAERETLSAFESIDYRNWKSSGFSIDTHNELSAALQKSQAEIETLRVMLGEEKAQSISISTTNVAVNTNLVRAGVINAGRGPTAGGWITNTLNGEFSTDQYQWLICRDANDRRQLEFAANRICGDDLRHTMNTVYKREAGDCDAELLVVQCFEE